MSPLAFGIGKSRGAIFDPSVFYSNWLQFYLHWTDGKDLDLRCQFIRPTQLAGQTLGADRNDAITNGDQSITYMKWGGDNTEDTVGYEGLYIDVPALQQIPGGLAGNIIEIDFRAIWYAEVGTNPVIVKASGYKGGTMALEKDTPNVPGYGFYNPNADQSFINYKESEGVILTETNREGNGQRIARMIIDLNMYQGIFWEP